MTPASKLEWSCMEDFSWKLDHHSLKPLTPPPHHRIEADEIDYQDYSLVVTGDVFRWMINHAPLETLQRVSNNKRSEVLSLNFLPTISYSLKHKYSHECPRMRRMKW
jgi:hypothetical protein